MESTNSFWSWNGKYVGYRISDFLFSNEGRQIGSFAEGDEIYGCGGFYVGEVRSGNRLIANLSKKAWTRQSFAPQPARTRSPGHPDMPPKDMLTGFEDFPNL